MQLRWSLIRDRVLHENTRSILKPKRLCLVLRLRMQHGIIGKAARQHRKEARSCGTVSTEGWALKFNLILRTASSSTCAGIGGLRRIFTARACGLNASDTSATDGIPFDSKNAPSCIMHVVHDPQSARASILKGKFKQKKEERKGNLEIGLIVRLCIYICVCVCVCVCMMF